MSVNSSDRTIRRATHAGSWYNAKAAVLKKQLENYIKAIDPTRLPEHPGLPKAVICPHAGYRYCAATGAYSWTRITECASNLRRIFILGPSHHLAFQGCALPDTELAQYETPFGLFDLDITCLIRLRRSGLFSTLSKLEDEAEHSIEMQLPFLHFMLASLKADAAVSIRIVPIVVGNLTSKIGSSISKLLQDDFDDSNSFFVISSDFCHWGSRFNFKYLPDVKDHHQNAINSRIEFLDNTAINILCGHDRIGFRKYLDETKNTICGENPIKILLELINGSLLKLHTYKLHYSQSSTITDPERDTSVSYSAIVTYSKDNEQ